MAEALITFIRRAKVWQKYYNQSTFLHQWHQKMFPGRANTSLKNERGDKTHEDGFEYPCFQQCPPSPAILAVFFTCLLGCLCVGPSLCLSVFWCNICPLHHGGVAFCIKLYSSLPFRHEFVTWDGVFCSPVGLEPFGSIFLCNWVPLVLETSMGAEM